MRSLVAGLIATAGLSTALLQAGVERGGARAGSVDPVDFATEIRPLLSDRCFRCHGPDGAAREAELRLDTRSGAMRDLGGYAAIVPGDRAKSELWLRLISEDASERMPPPHSNLSLAAEEVERIGRWIDAGAEYAQHWAFTTPRREPVSSGDAHPVDAFLAAAASLEGVELAPLADRATWLRRASFDLTGLPPTVEELDRFLATEDTDASWRAEIERLLASPRYGERMAADWLDLARYADTYGYQSDVARRVWPWRDWVIGAFNANLSYDRFATLQLAGDLVSDATRETRLATTFLRLHRQTNEGGSVEEEFRLEYVADRVNTVGTAFLGLTLECARCHDHKYDPISQKEYFALSAYFDDIDESGLYSHFTDAVPTPTLELPSVEQEADLARLRDAVSEAEARLEQALSAAEHASGGGVLLPDGLEPRTPSAHFPLDRSDDDPASPNLADRVDSERSGALLDAPRLVPGKHGEALRFSGDDNAHFPGVGAFHRSDPFSLSLHLRIGEEVERAVVLHRSRAWTDAGSRGYQLVLEDGRLSASLIHFWPGNALRVRAVDPLTPGQWKHVVWTYDGSSRAAGLKLWLDGEEVPTEVVRDGLTRRITGGGEGPLTLAERFRDRGFRGGSIDELKVFGHELRPLEVRFEAGVSSLDELLADAELVSDFAVHALDEDVAGARESLRLARRAFADARDAVPEIMTMARHDPPRRAYVLGRGSYLDPREEVGPGVPASLTGAVAPSTAAAAISKREVEPSADRLEFAAWLTAPENPLFARVAVNRLWTIAFGRGLVATPENFGNQGETPSHPELLDWLALEFVESGYDVKGMLAFLMRSRAYRASSEIEGPALERDPKNRLFARGQRSRLPAEMVRDLALATSGLLVEKVGGPSVKPYQPEGLWRDKSGQSYQRDEGEGLYRRSLYTFWKRTSPPPAMMIFDALEREVCTAERRITNTPLQALALWNDPQRIEAARVLAERLLEMPNVDDEERCAHAFRSITGRTPDAEELAILLAALDAEREAFAAMPDDAAALLAIGDAPPLETRDTGQSDPADSGEHAAWTWLMNLLLSHDAAVTRN